MSVVTLKCPDIFNEYSFIRNKDKRVIPDIDTFL